MINLDAPHHLQLRREHMPFFTPAYLNQLKSQGRRRSHAHGRRDGAQGRGRHGRDVFVAPAALHAVRNPGRAASPDRAEIPRTGCTISNWRRTSPPTRRPAPIAPSLELIQFVADFNANVEEMFAYGQHMLHKRRNDPQADLMSAIARAQIDGQFLSDEYLDGSWLLIVFAGNDTTRNTLSGAMKLLTEFPDQKAKLIAQPDLLGNAADEFIRMVSPVIYMRRTALCTTRRSPARRSPRAKRSSCTTALPTAIPPCSRTRRAGCRARQREQAHRLRLRPPCLPRQARGADPAGGGLPPAPHAPAGHRMDRRDRHRAEQFRPRHPQARGALHGEIEIRPASGRPERGQGRTILGEIISGARRLSTAGVNERAARAASGLASLGVGKGDIVALFLRNDLAFFEASTAVGLLGAYPTPVNWHGTPEEARYIFENSAREGDPDPRRPPRPCALCDPGQRHDPWSSPRLPARAFGTGSTNRHRPVTAGHACVSCPRPRRYESRGLTRQAGLSEFADGGRCMKKFLGAALLALSVSACQLEVRPRLPHGTSSHGSASFSPASKDAWPRSTSCATRHPPMRRAFRISMSRNAVRQPGRLDLDAPRPAARSLRPARLWQPRRAPS